MPTEGRRHRASSLDTTGEGLFAGFLLSSGHILRLNCRYTTLLLYPTDPPPPPMQVCNGITELSPSLLAPVADAATWLRNPDLLAATSAKLIQDASSGSAARSLAADDLVQLLITLHTLGMLLPSGTAVPEQPSSQLSKKEAKQRWQQQQHLGEVLMSALPGVLSRAAAAGRTVGSEGLMELYSRLEQESTSAGDVAAPGPARAPSGLQVAGGHAVPLQQRGGSSATLLQPGGSPAEAPMEAALKALLAAAARPRSGPQRPPPSHHALGGASGLYLRYAVLRQQYAPHSRLGMAAGGDDEEALRLGRSVRVLQAYVGDGGCLPWALALMADDLCSQLEGIRSPSA